MSFLSDLPSPKVIGAALGGAGGLALSDFLVWLIGASFYHVGFGAEVQDAAVNAVPRQLKGVVYLILTMVGIVVPGYQITDPARNVSESTDDHVLTPVSHFEEGEVYDEPDVPAEEVAETSPDEELIGA